ncbi:molybdopterin dinucleotide binding domain-containing protein [Lebetimonas sp. JS032]|uniref:molybdopterin dinucleotide binding domain-containing protein n=1 Tax=Lebetimonas sp. JS032 TaxID=990070 RepID=UPI00046599E1|nr:molybdopterin dinucleotide binding domain-containing protein [Lebetimonas sp. JS032]
MDKKRRNFLIGTSAVAASASIVGYKKTLKQAVTMSTDGEKAKDPIYGNSYKPEYSYVNDQFVPNDDFKICPTTCIGCVTQCGVRVKIDKKTDKVLRVFGNPYNLLSSDPWLPYNTSIKESYEILSQNGKFEKYRSNVCARGNAVFDKIDDKFRVLKPLKRVGKRGENKWKEIEIEQLIDEIVNGGNLFGEGHVKGLKDVRDIKTPINPDEPVFGPKSNGLCFIGTTHEGRFKVVVNRFLKSFGTCNWAGHGATCGLSMRAGEAAYLGNFKKYPHLKPDFENTEYLLSIGTPPGQAGNPFKRQGKLLARARSEGNIDYTIVSPMQGNSDMISAGSRSHWIPIKPGTDLAFVMGVLQIIINNKMYNKKYLSMPSAKAMKALNDVSWTNAAHLIIQDKDGFGKILKDGKIPLVLDATDNTLKSSNDVIQAVLDFKGSVEYKGKTYSVRTSFNELKENVNELSLQEYSKECGVSIETMQEVAKKLVTHGRKASVDCHGGTMHTTGFYTAYAVMLLGAMVGSLNYKGGMSAGGGAYKDFIGKKYNLFAYKGKPNIKATRIDRARMSYEKTNEYKNKLAKGENPYPAKGNWFPFTSQLSHHILNNSAEGYPYKLDVLITNSSDFLYGTSGSESKMKELLADPKKSIPLFIAVDPFINDTSKYADYIVPDSVLYETWGIVHVWNGYLTKCNTLRFPVVKPKQATFKNGEPIEMISFMIALGKKLKLPGFGEKAIKGNDGNWYPLNKAEDIYLRAFENIAMDGTPVPDATDEDIKLSGIEDYVPSLKRICGKNWRKTAYVMARGGRYEDVEDSYKGEFLAHQYKKPVQIYNETVGTTRNSLTGERYSGTIKFFKQRQVGGKTYDEIYPKDKYPLTAFSFKSNVLATPDANSNNLAEIRFTTYIDLNPKTAKEFGLNLGDLVEVASEYGKVKGYLRYRNGVMPGCIGVEHGLGRDASGAENIVINGKTIKAIIRRKSGVDINKIGLLDPTAGMQTASDFVCGSNARHAIPVKIKKVKGV